MTYPLASARKWCNDSEFALVSASFGGDEIAWTPALLRAKIERTRKLRNKSLDKSRQIRRANRASIGSKVGKQVTAMAVAEKRAKLFDETLARFVAKLEKLQAAKRLKPLRVAVAGALEKKRARKPAAGGRAAPVSVRGHGNARPAAPSSKAADAKRAEDGERPRTQRAQPGQARRARLSARRGLAAGSRGHLGEVLPKRRRCRVSPGSESGVRD